ncbi:MAG: class I SAM-dependent methyltransferase [Verrucomicrobiae bacterium]|nr:class I SAM-dependent methyltransferase [Verrucomicrobiae bacterium]
MQLEPVNCALCGRAESDLVFSVPSLRLRTEPRSFELRRCRSCGLVRLSPRPVAEAMALLYQPQHYTAPRRDLVRRLEGLILRERVSYVRSHTRGHRILDVGCGTGSLLQALSMAGYDVHGLEPYQDALAGVPEGLRSRIQCRPFEAADYPADNFDIITLWHVLEHLARPVETLQSIRKFLKADGTLLLEVPNFASREARWLGRHWYNLDAPYHFWHFTPETLEAVVQRAGFQVVARTTSAVTRPVWLLNYLLLGATTAAEWWQARHPAWGKWPRASLGLGLSLCLGSRVLFAGSCPMMRLVCRKST